ncbi:alpha/beta hydrolase family protein [Paracidobacterium acidisoli]|nr:acetylxylan esterase [Paracidobacterium acidisoli]MBT9333076.1 acetylxylan esterase [Paracidobacterium acidisoli]
MHRVPSLPGKRAASQTSFRLKWPLPLALLSCCLWLGAAACHAQTAAAPSAPTYEDVLNRMTQPFLDQRRDEVAKIHTRAQAEARQAAVRATILRLIGGLPDNHDPLNGQVVGTLQQDGFHIERIIYDSLPGYHVTANLYIPDHGHEPFPAVVVHAGHGPFGKLGGFGMGSVLARNGIAVLAYDPLGSGERLQAMNPATGKSWAGPDEHSQAQIPISLTGDHVSRYMVWDAMRGVDYLATRHDIDMNNIGSFGCSGGGTLSAYFIALDTRVKAGAVACYLTSTEELLKSIGPQDGEQVIPSFTKSGLDFADWVELAAPRAYAMISTTEDMFPFAGARATHDEAARFYSLYGAKDNLQWFTGPGHHGAIRPLMPQIISFFMKHLANSDAQPDMTALHPPPAKELLCTTTGQVTTALPGRTIYEINREKAKMVEPPKANVTSHAQLAKLQTSLRREILRVTGMEPADRSIPAIDFTTTEKHDGYVLKTGMFHSRTGLLLPVRIAIPENAGRHPALLMTDIRPVETWTGSGSAFEQTAVKGSVVLALTPLPWPKSTDQDRPTMGTMLPMTSRAFLIGKTFVGMRAEDDLAAVNWLAAQPQTNTHDISAFAEGSSGVVLLHAAVLDSRIAAITLDHSLISYQSVVDVPVHRGVTESVIPGVLLHYDLDDLMIALAPRRLTISNPVTAAGDVLDQADFRSALSRVYEADSALGLSDHLQFLPSAQ